MSSSAAHGFSRDHSFLKSSQSTSRSAAIMQLAHHLYKDMCMILVASVPLEFHQLKHNNKMKTVRELAIEKKIWRSREKKAEKYIDLKSSKVRHGDRRHAATCTPHQNLNTNGIVIMEMKFKRSSYNNN
jgi:hypothetical protein